jgi:hypothetical protein
VVLGGIGWYWVVLGGIGLGRRKVAWQLVRCNSEEGEERAFTNYLPMKIVSKDLTKV